MERITARKTDIPRPSIHVRPICIVSLRIVHMHGEAKSRRLFSNIKLCQMLTCARTNKHYGAPEASPRFYTLFYRHGLTFKRRNKPLCDTCSALNLNAAGRW